MKLVLAPNGTIEYDLDDELFELEIVRLLSMIDEKVSDRDVVRALLGSPWERMQHA